MGLQGYVGDASDARKIRGLEAKRVADKEALEKAKAEAEKASSKTALREFGAGESEAAEAAFKEIDGGYTGAPEVVPVPPELVVEPYFNDQINRFIEAILTGRPAQPDLERGLYIQGLIDALAKAAVTGGVVKL